MTQSKECFKCNKIKPITAFYKHRGMFDGHLNKCKECAKFDSTEHRYNNIDRVRVYDKGRGFRGTRSKVYNKNKKPAIGSCILCNSKDKLEKHHPDYDRPYFIVTLCRSCHKKTHSIIRLNSTEIRDLAMFTQKINTRTILK